MKPGDGGELKGWFFVKSRAQVPVQVAKQKSTKFPFISISFVFSFQVLQVYSGNSCSWQFARGLSES